MLRLAADHGSATRSSPELIKKPVVRVHASSPSCAFSCSDSQSRAADEAFGFYARIGELTADRGASYQNKLANKLHGALLTVCENASSAERSRWIRALPDLPVPFAQILVRALVRVAFDKVRDPLQELAAGNSSLPAPVAFAAALIGGALGGILFAFLALPTAGVILAAYRTYGQYYEVVDDDSTAAPAVAPGKTTPDGERRTRWFGRRKQRPPETADPPPPPGDG